MAGPTTETALSADETPVSGRARAPMRLAIVVRALWAYRNQFYDEIAQRLGPADEVAVFAGDSVGYRPDQAAALHLSHVRVTEVPPLRGKNGWLAKDWPNPSLWNRLQELNPTHVWVHEFSPYVLLAWTWAKIHRRPCYISTEIGDRFTARYSHPNKKYQNFLKRRSAGVIAHSQAAYETAQRVAPRALFVPHAIDTTAYVPREWGATPGGKVRLLQAGLLDERKGVDLLLKAFRRCVDARVADLELAFLGGGDQLWVEELIRSLDLQNNAKVLPFARGAELIETYRQADIFVHASREDTYAVVVHEAAACGLPLVVSQYAGASETLVEEGKNGFVVDPYDAEAFSAAILRLATDADLRRAFGEQARRRAEIFSVQENAAKMVAWLRE